MDPISDISTKIAVNTLTELFKTAWSGLGSAVKWAKSSDVLGLAASKYIENLNQRHSMMRILGMERPIPLRSIYVRVNLLDKLTSRTAITIKELELKFNKDTRAIGKINSTINGDELLRYENYVLSSDRVRELDANKPNFTNLKRAEYSPPLIK